MRIYMRVKHDKNIQSKLTKQQINTNIPDKYYNSLERLIDVIWIWFILSRSIKWIQRKMNVRDV